MDSIAKQMGGGLLLATASLLSLLVIGCGTEQGQNRSSLVPAAAPTSPVATAASMETFSVTAVRNSVDTPEPVVTVVTCSAPSGCQPPPQPGTARPPAMPQRPVGVITAQVVNVVDGDTIDVVIDGQQYRVRYIGMDTPETVDPRRPVEAFGREASDRNKELVAGQTVYLEKDVSETDQFDRLLRYVWLDDERMVNAMLLAEGLAQVSTYPPDVRYVGAFVVIQADSRDAGRGMWATSGNGIGTTPVDASPVAGRAQCDPAYPDVCIPPSPPDLDCADFTFRRFKVLPLDPHRFDADGNGVGCEQ